MELPQVFTPPRRWALARLVAIGVGQALAVSATAWGIQQTFDRFVTVEPSGTSQQFGLLLGMLALAVGCAAWLRVAERVCAEQLGQDYVNDVRKTLFEHMARMAPRELQRWSRGGLMLRFLGDLTALRQWISLGLARLLLAGVVTLGTLFGLFLIDRSLALLVAGVLLVGGLTSYRLGDSMEDAVRQSRRRRTRLASNVQEKIASMAVVQVHGQTQRERRRVARQGRRLKKSMVRRARVGGWMRSVVHATIGFATLGALFIGAREVATGSATPGGVVAAISLVGLLAPQMRDLGRVNEYWRASQVSLEKLRNLLAAPELYVKDPQAQRTRRGGGRLSFRGVAVEGVFEDLSARAPAGSRVVIVGPNGSGKSTLLALAARQLDPDRGRVLLDGRNLAKLKLGALRRAIGVVGPDLPLLRGTVLENLRYRWPEAPEEEVRRVCELCGVDEVLAELEHGTATRLTEGGRNLSVGQRHRIALARALLGSPRLLLLDEADAHLDGPARRILERVIDEYPGTVLLVTHHADRLAAADRIWTLADGRLKERLRSRPGRRPEQVGGDLALSREPRGTKERA